MQHPTGHNNQITLKAWLGIGILCFFSPILNYALFNYHSLKVATMTDLIVSNKKAKVCHVLVQGQMNYEM